MIIKDWGKAYPLFESPTCRVVRVEIEAGWQCSFHYHSHQSNSFYVLSGELAVIEAWDGGERKTFLKAGDFYDVPLGACHCFQSLTDVVALEIYHGECDPNDIVRLEKGFRYRE